MSERNELIKKEESMPARRDIPAIAPLVDIYENDHEILMHADMPGVAKEDISINIDNGKLSILGTRKTQTSGAETWVEFGDVEYVRTFSVPQSIDVAKVNAELNDGVLHLHLPKSEAAKPRQIEIKAA
ncbi:MAG: Hsp20/alpha crystallin family protein [Proteobacteria bacterium]|nr:Hsp20/alpha crystallin family protein [Pseudomonadota bacterium]MBU1687859.1 Hsp20/alpha crystallin family protein [Pseudomonadota bacterium]